MKNVALDTGIHSIASEWNSVRLSLMKKIPIVMEFLFSHIVNPSYVFSSGFEKARTFLRKVTQLFQMEPIKTFHVFLVL